MQRRAVATAAAAAAAAAQRATLGSVRLPPVSNEPFKHYAPGSPERAALQAALKRVRSSCPEIPVVINGKEIFTGDVEHQVMPTDHGHRVSTFHRASPSLVNEAIVGALKAQRQWEALPLEDRLAIFLKAADLTATKYRADVCAAVMLGTGKNTWQAEIDSAVELCDFWRFNALYGMRRALAPSTAQQVYEMQPPCHSPGSWNRIEYRPLEGFVAAITPFNFLAIGSNLACAPAQMGNVALWKPSETAMLGSYLIFKILREAGLPDGVVQFLPGSGPVIGAAMLQSPDLAGIHFTGSTATFKRLWRDVAGRLDTYKSFPRLVGETGGKNFHFVHESARSQLDHVVHNTIRGAFEYCGQKCSAPSRLYVPDTLWPAMRTRMIEVLAEVRMGQPDDPNVLVTAVINEASFDKIKGYLDAARTSKTEKIVYGGGCDKSRGYFIEPTVIETTDPRSPTMVNELFGPVLTVYVYPARDYEAALRLCDQSVAYGLTGSLFATDRYALELGSRTLRNAAGNFYLNDKSTGALVGQQPFGGSRASGTNDKSGSLQHMLRWVSPRVVKENFLPLTSFRYPSMQPDHPL